MATTEPTRGGDAFPAVNATRELNLGVPEQFPLDPLASEVATARELKEAEARTRAKAAAAKAEADKCCSTLKSALVVSGVVAVVIGVAFIVTKKMKNT